MGERARLRLVFLPSVDVGQAAAVSPKERPISPSWQDDLSSSLEPATPTTPTTPREAAAPWATDDYQRPRAQSGAPRKLLVLGDSGVGKTAVVTRYVSGTFSEKTESTAGVRSWTRQDVPLQDGPLCVQITELSAESSFQGMAELFYKEAHGCVVVFDLGDRRSLRGALQWKRRVDELCSLPGTDGFPSLLLANKCDITRGRAVTQWEVEDVVKQANFLTWIEVSAKYDFMVGDAIGYLLRVVLARMGPMATASSTVRLDELTDAAGSGRSCCWSGSRSATSRHPTKTP